MNRGFHIKQKQTVPVVYDQIPRNGDRERPFDFPLIEPEEDDSDAAPGISNAPYS